MIFRWSDTRLLTFIVVLAFATRGGFAVNQIRKIPRPALAEAPFAQETGNIAYSLATGKGFSNPFRRETGPTAWLTPVYPLIVAASFRVLGTLSVTSFFFLVFLNIIFSSAVCVPIFYASARIAGRAVAGLAAFLWAIYPSAVMMPFEWIWDTSLSALLAATLLWATLAISESLRRQNWGAYGLLWGLTLMTNPSLATLLPFLVGWSAYRACRLSSGQSSVGSTKWIAAPALALLIVIACCVPWTVRNYAVFHRFIPLRSNFPLELYIGNNENYDDKHPRFPGFITKDRETLRYFRMGEIPFMDEEMRKAKAFIFSHPRVELILFAERFAAFWIGLPNAWQNLVVADWLVRTLMLCGFFSGVEALAGILVLIAQRSSYTFPLAVYPVAFPVLYYITHTSVRYRHPIEPIVLLLASVALVAAWRTGRRVFLTQLSCSTPRSLINAQTFLWRRRSNLQEENMPARKSSSRRRYSRGASKSVASAMRRRKHGTLRSGKGGKGGRVKSRKQAIAIGLSEARKKGAKVPRKKSS